MQKTKNLQLDTSFTIRQAKDNQKRRKNKIYFNKQI